MRRVLLAGALALLLLPAGAGAAVPSLGAVSATDLQGASAVLVGSVDPEGLASTYYFEYTTAPSFSGASKTTTSPAGQGNEPRPARAAIAGLNPSSTYHLRLVASNSSGTTTGASATFTTTQGFGFLVGEAGFSARAIADGGAPASVAGSHPYALELGVGLRQGGEFEGQPGVPFPDGDLRDLHIQMPAGMILNPRAIGRCSLADFNTQRSSPFEEPSLAGESCPDRSQVGTLEVKSSLDGAQGRSFGLFSLDPPPGVPTQIGASPYGQPLAFDVEIHSLPGGAYVLSLDATGMPQALDLSGLSLRLWGTPWSASHDFQRGDCLNEAQPAFGWCKHSVGEPKTEVPKAYLSLPARCGEALSFSASAGSWQQPTQASASAQSLDAQGKAPAVSDCANLAFHPQPLAFLTDSKASSSTGFNFRLQNDNAGFTTPQLRAPAQARSVSVSLPPGTSINPSVGAGLGACTVPQYQAETPFSPQGQGCPNAAKIGDFTVGTPLFEGALDGAIYLAKPYENPLGALIAVYLVAKSPARGVLYASAGKILPDPVTGDLTAIFEDLPQLPYDDLNVNFRTGQRALMITPPSCGSAQSKVTMAPWAVGPATTTATTASQISSGIEAGPCPSGPLPFSPGVLAGGVNSNVNSYTPYFVHLSRKDTEQEITGYSLVLPKGITGKLAGIPFCPDSAIEAARRKSGVAEEQSPSCPASSQVGRVETGYGVGPSLTYTSGRIYLAGPYNGQPLSVVTINPATVGPFDLGVVVIRSAFAVDQHTAQLRIDKSASDAIPHILGGIPLHLRDVRIHMDRPQFTHNPSSCEAAKLESSLGGAGNDFSTFADDTTASVSEHFQLLNCLTLGFEPKLGIRLRGGTHRGAFPQLRATFAARGPGDTNLKEITVALPHSEFLAQNHIRAICTRAQFGAERCPTDSAYGSATAFTPLFDDPLRGNVYLRSSSHKLPDLVADLHSGAIRIVLEGKIGPTKQGGIQAYFANLPDEPVDRFVMVLNGGKRGLLTNSADICKSPPEATVKALGQTNLGTSFTTVLRGQCKGQKKSKRGGR